MSQGHVADALVKLNREEITKLIMEHTGVVDAIATKFDGHYLSPSVQVKDYREFLEEMDKHLTRAEELTRILEGNSDGKN